MAWKWMAVCAVLGVCVLALGGCPAQEDAIGVSQASYDFGLSKQPWNFEVWNTNPASFASLDFNVSTSANWILCDPDSGTSTGSADRRVITVSVNRHGLAAGEHTGYIDITARGAKAVRVNIALTSDGSDVNTGAFAMGGVTQYNSAPYLVDFSFSLHDKDGAPVRDIPGAFDVTCAEDAVAISPDESPHFFARASQKQLKCMLVLDYTASMASISANGDANSNGISDAIEAMESGVTGNFLPKLSSDAQVGVYEFHRETAPRQVCDFTADKPFVANSIAGIWPSLQYWGPSRCWDAVFSAILQFMPTNQSDENCNIIFLSDGRDTSSTHTRQEVIDFAKGRAVRVYCIGFGKELDRATLQAVTTSTDGSYFEAASPAEIGTMFNRIIDDFGAQYALRWTTLKRGLTVFTPSFSIALGGLSAFYESPATYPVPLYTGDELGGLLRTVPSLSGGKTTYYLRAQYVPRFIWRLRFFAKSIYPFTVQSVSTADGGLCGDWTIAVTDDADLGGKWIDLESPNPGSIESPIPYAAFGPILHFDFLPIRKAQDTPFDVLYVDNGIYTEGQSFSIQDWDNVLPAAQ